MNAGTLRERVTLQSEGTRTDDGFGGGVVGRTDVTTRWAKVEPLSGTEAFEARQFSPKVSHKVTIRYYAGIKPSWRLKYGTRYFNIQAIIDVNERHREVILYCEELPAP